MANGSWDGIPLKGTPNQGRDENGSGHIQFREGILGSYDSNGDLKIDVWNPSGGAYDPTAQEPWQTVPAAIASPGYRDHRPADGTPLLNERDGKLYRFQTDRYVVTAEQPEVAEFGADGKATKRGYGRPTMKNWFEIGDDSFHPSPAPAAKAAQASALSALVAAAAQYLYVSKA